MTHFLDRLPFDWDVPAARELRELLASCYDEPAEVKAMAREAGVVVSRVLWQQSVHGVWHDLITVARNQNKLRPLLALVEEGPDVAVAERLRELTGEHPVVESPQPATPPDTWADCTGPGSPERQLFPVSTFQDVAFLRRGTELATAVCRLLLVDSRGGRFHGTAFRIGLDLLLTNHHVLHAPTGARVERIEAWFGYEQDLDGRQLEHVTVVCDPASVVGDADNDWAVVRAAGPLPVEAATVSLTERPTVKVDDRVYIIQHPYGGVKKLAARHNIVRHVDDRIVQYWTDTEKGSSGSPSSTNSGVSSHSTVAKPRPGR